MYERDENVKQATMGRVEPGGACDVGIGYKGEPAMSEPVTSVLNRRAEKLEYEARKCRSLARAIHEHGIPGDVDTLLAAILR